MTFKDPKVLEISTLSHSAIIPLSQMDDSFFYIYCLNNLYQTLLSKFNISLQKQLQRKERKHYAFVSIVVAVVKCLVISLDEKCHTM